MPKRKSNQLEVDDSVEAAAEAPRRSTRKRTSTYKSAAARDTPAPATTPAPAPAPATRAKEPKLKPRDKPLRTANAKARSKKSKQQQSATTAKTETGDIGGEPRLEKLSAEESKSGDHVDSSRESTPSIDRQYWLMKAEPDSRLENGVDVKFSIDDLAAKTEPEPWDGIRNFVARNNLRAMKKGDLAFFYHSNCKEPGIVGTMKVVEEHSPDLSAHDPKCPYYDRKSSPSDPKWSVVHVEFRSKFAVPIGLKALREMGASGKPLENMQMLKQSRLSVSKVSKAEWGYLMGVAEEKAKTAG